MRFFLMCLALLVLHFPIGAQAMETIPTHNVNSSETPLMSKVTGMHLEAVRNDLRQGSAQYLRWRRAMILAACIASLAIMVVTLYQVGVISWIPDFPGAIFDSAQINTSDTAYRFLIPDGPIVLIGLGVTIALAAFGSADRFLLLPWLPVLICVIVLVQAYFAASYLYSMITVEHRACVYCVVTALAQFTICACSFPEAKAAISHWMA